MKTHGMTGTRLCKCYNSMKERAKHYKYCTKLGIKVCEEWLNNPKSFFDWAINNGYADNLTLDRIDVYGDYEPSNCRWITKAEQQRNRTNTCYITVGGITKTAHEWATETGLPYATLMQRKQLGFSEEEILKPKYEAKKKPNSKYSYFQLITIDGETKTALEWSKISGVAKETIIQRKIHGWTDKKLIQKSQRSVANG